MMIGAAGLMDVLGVGNAAAGGGAGVLGGGAAAAGGAPFSGLLHNMIEQSSQLDAKASDAVQGMLSGQGVEVHDAMIASQKADMAFELALQVRNKAVAAYQTMMSMQF